MMFSIQVFHPNDDNNNKSIRVCYRSSNSSLSFYYAQSGEEKNDFLFVFIPFLPLSLFLLIIFSFFPPFFSICFTRTYSRKMSNEPSHTSKPHTNSCVHARFLWTRKSEQRKIFNSIGNILSKSLLTSTVDSLAVQLFLPRTLVWWKTTVYRHFLVINLQGFSVTIMPACVERERLFFFHIG